MATVFLSHASRDDDLAKQLEAWLTAEGFEDLFVDHSDIRGGDKWTEALRRAKGAARVVLCLVTPRWLASDECFGEFTAAWYAGQRIVPLLAADPAALDERQAKRLGRVLGEDQGFDLTPALNDGRLDLDAAPAIAEPLKAGLRAGGALAKIGLDPEAFEVDPEVRPAPFPASSPSVTPTPTPPSSTAARQKSPAAWRTCGRCAPAACASPTPSSAPPARANHRC